MKFIILFIHAKCLFLLLFKYFIFEHHDNINNSLHDKIKTFIQSAYLYMVQRNSKAAELIKHQKLLLSTETFFLVIIEKKEIPKRK